MRVLVVDDEPLVREGLREALARHPDIELVGEAGDGIEAARLIRQAKPELVLLDVQMPGPDGFRLLARLALPPLVIFVTAYDEYALRAFDAHAVDYLLKPFDRRRLDRALDRARALLAVGQTEPVAATAALHTLQRRPQRTAHRLAFGSGSRVILVDANEIEYARAEGNYVRLCLVDGASHLVRESLTNLEVRLAPDGFVRIHRSALVNAACVRELRTRPGGETRVLMRSGQRLRASESGRRRFQSLLEAWG